MGHARNRFAIASLSLALAMPVGAFAQSTQVGNPPGTPQVEQPEAGGVNWKGAGIGAATLLANVGYIPAKTVYGILGGIAGAAGFALTGGNQQTANSIWRSSLGGDYVVTPEMIRGDVPIHFSGPSAPMMQPAPVAPQPLTSNPPPTMAASSAPAVYPNSAPNTGAATSMAPHVGAPPLSVPSSSGTYSSSRSHFSTTITGPGDSGTGPVRERDIE